jgi:hypothetical protein
MKNILTIIFCLFVSLTLCGQNADEDIKKQASTRSENKNLKDTGWIKGGFFSTNLSNATFSNWAQGGSNNTALIATSNLFAIYKSESGKSIWENYLDLAYGMTRNGKPKMEDPLDPSKQIKNPFVKNEDKFVFLSKYGRKINEILNYSALFTLNTQLFPGWGPKDILRRDNHVSNFMAPAFGYVSVGLDYKPLKWISVYVSPLTAKYTIVREQRLADMGVFGVKAAEFNDFSDTFGGRPPRMSRRGEKFRTEFGWYMNVSMAKDIAKNINLQSRIELFQNYKTMAVKQIDFNWQSTLNMKVNKYVTVVLIHQMIWDYDIDTKLDEEGVQRNWQTKNFFGVGFSAKFGDTLDTK